MTTAEETLRILVADDHAPTRADVRRALVAEEGFEICAEAANAAEAVQAAVRERPDVCLLDIRMPGSGLAAAWEIASRLPDAKIVMLTVSDEDSELFAALHAGADGYLLKTIDLSELPRALRAVVNGEAPIDSALVTRVLQQFRGSDPRRRRLAAGGELGERLTSREWEVLELLARDASTAEIARRLTLSRSAVRVHIASIVRKLDVADRAAAVELFRTRSGT